MISKGILMSILMIGVVAAGAGAGTLAYFSDVEESTGNTFTAGTIDISVDDGSGFENPWDRTGYVIEAHALQSKVYYDEMNITNVGENELDLYKHIDNVVDVDGTPDPEPEMTAETGEDGQRDDLSNHTYYDLNVTDKDGLREIVKLSEWQTLRDRECNYTYLGTLQPDEWMIVNQSYHLDCEHRTDALKVVDPNVYQGDGCTFDIEYRALQVGQTP